MMGRPRMMGGMGMGGGPAAMCGRMTSHVEGRIAFLKAELKITPEQEALWNDYANAVRDNAKAMGSRCTITNPRCTLCDPILTRGAPPARGRRSKEPLQARTKGQNEIIPENPTTKVARSTA